MISFTIFTEVILNGKKKNYNYEETAVQHSYIRTIPVLKLNYIWAEKLKRVAVATMYQGQAAV